MKSAWPCMLALSLAPLVYAQAPVVNAGGVINSASYASGGVAPGSIVSIFGINLAGQTVVAGSIPLPTALDTVRSVTFNGISAGLYFVSPKQINAQLPWNVLPSGSNSGAVNVVVSTSGGSSAPQSVQVVQALPGIFTATANGLGQAVATNNTDGAVAAATLSIPGLMTHPVQVGSYLIIWCTGLGSLESPIPNGTNPSGQTVNTALKPVVLIGGVQATLIYSVISPQYVSEYQVGVQVASGTPTGPAVPLQIQMNGVTSSSAVTIAVSSEPGAEPAQTDCMLNSAGCVSVNLDGIDPFSTAGGFGGYADPTIRQDPVTGTLWMAYSWPHTIPSDLPGTPGTQVVDIHLAYSTDGGKSWTYAGPLYESEPVVNPVTGATDYTSHEVMNLLPQVVNGVTYWYGVHSTYYVPKGRGGPDSETYTKRWQISMAPGTATTGPMGLASAAVQYVGQNVNTYSQYFPLASNLSSLNAEVSACNVYYEPTLIMSGNNLYLFLSCTPPNANPAGEFYAVFKTADPQDHAGNWQWTYVPQGSVKFANQSDAASVARYLGPGATYITQMDIVPSKQPGVLLAILTAAYNNFQGKVSLGCLAAEIANVDPPSFVYDAQGQVQVDALITSPDSEDDGPGSCTYSPFSATGMIMAHRQTSNAPQNGGFFTFLMQSLLFP